MLGYIAKTNIQHNGISYKKNDFISNEVLDEQSEKRLLFLNVIQKSYKEVGIVSNNKNYSTQKINEEKKESVEETLDLNFEPEELKAGAKELGLEFAGNISKKKIIALIIENDKTAYFLDQLED
ncbi:hypothetical protein [Lysinibacillus irui]|uniref:hypothetical protein n=1 Tax=Lysinibacillus irui TaxID=2998077 RepID=UPI002AD2E9D9|nr:hypothetical protein [Lysinibacillus irui]MEA0565528.1 hypothetical protein [Lysinibacillus irui]